MSANKLPEFNSEIDLIDFFEKNDMGDYDLAEAHFDVNIQKRKFLVAVDQDLMKKISKAARARKTSTSDLVNSWLEEKVIQAA